jgi:hypothetical protein
VSPRTAYRTGEAFRELGVGWCSGPVALYAARHYPDFMATVRAVWGRVSEEQAEFGCGLYVYAQLVVESELFDGFLAAARTAPRWRAFTEPNQRTLDRVARLPQDIEAVRRKLSFGTARMDSVLRTLAEESVPGPRHATSPRPERADRWYLQPALGVLRSECPPAASRGAARQLLCMWLQEAACSEQSPGGDASMQVWNEAFPIATISTTGEMRYVSVVGEDRELLAVMREAMSLEVNASLTDTLVRERHVAPIPESAG